MCRRPVGRRRRKGVSISDPVPPPKPGRRALQIVAGLVLVSVAVALLWDWNWFRGLVEARATVEIGRPVQIGRLEVHLGRVTRVVLHDVRIANPPGFVPDAAEFLVMPTLTVDFAAETYLRTRKLALPLVQADAPVISMLQAPDGGNNWTIAAPALPADGQAAASDVAIGDVVINDGQGRLSAPLAGTDMAMSIATGDSEPRSITIDAKGTHAHQPITAHLVGGALLSLRDAAPYPIALELANGDTKVSLKGTLRDPLALAGADINLVIAGQDMAALSLLTGIPIPKTPPYRVAGKLDFGEGLIKFSNIVGRVGSSDLAGALAVDPRPARPVLTGSLMSKSVDMQDLGGFVGSTPGRTTTPGQTPGQAALVRRAEASPQLLPNTPIGIPGLRLADVHITYRGEHIIGQNIPFDSLEVKLDIEDGHIHLEPARITVGGGQVTAIVDLDPNGDTLAAAFDGKIEHIDIGRVLKSSGLGSGRGVIDGNIKLKGSGNSLAAIVGHGDGSLSLNMSRAGDVNSVLLDLSGLQLGRAVLSALGIPDKEALRCIIVEAPMRQGVATTTRLVIDTSEHIVTGSARADFGREVLDMRLRTDAKHFTIGSLSTPIRIAGPFKNLSVSPEAGELAVRGGAAVGLGLLFPPAALLPTIQFGVGETSPCQTPRK